MGSGSKKAKKDSRSSDKKGKKDKSSRATSSAADGGGGGTFSSASSRGGRHGNNNAPYSETQRRLLLAAERERVAELRAVMADDRGAELLLRRKKRAVEAWPTVDSARAFKLLGAGKRPPPGRGEEQPAVALAAASAPKLTELAFAGPEELMRARRITQVTFPQPPAPEPEPEAAVPQGRLTQKQRKLLLAQEKEKQKLGEEDVAADAQEQLRRLELAMFQSKAYGNDGNFGVDTRALQGLFAPEGGFSSDSDSGDEAFRATVLDFQPRHVDELDEYLAPPKWSMGDLTNRRATARRQFAGSSTKASEAFESMMNPGGTLQDQSDQQQQHQQQSQQQPPPQQQQQQSSAAVHENLETKRWEYLVRSRLRRGQVRSVMNEALGLGPDEVGVSDRSAAAMAGVAKLFVADLTQSALASLEDWGDGSADKLQPGHVREAYRREHNAGSLPFLARKRRRLR